MDAFCNDFKKIVLGWSVSLRYQLEHGYDVSNWSTFFMYQWGIAETSQIGSTSWNIVMMSQHGSGC